MTARERKSLKSARLARNWTQVYLACQLGVSRERIAQIEQGRVRPGPNILGRIRAALDMERGQ